MIAPAGIERPSVTGGGDCRTGPALNCAAAVATAAASAMPFKSSEVPGGVISGVDPLAEMVEAAPDPALTEGVRLCLVKYEADRGNAGLECTLGEAGLVPWNEDLRLTEGDEGAEDAGERYEGGV